jgi:hypothetical protein
MIILIGAAAAGVAVAASYLVPLIISCVVGGVTIIITFVTTRAVYKKNKAKDAELNELKREQAQRDNKVREEASRVAEETGIDMQLLMQLSREQQLELKKVILKFTENIEESNQAAISINQIASSIQTAASSAVSTTEELNIELDKIKAELFSVNEKLKQAEKALSLKEMELHHTIERLIEVEEKMSEDFALNQANTTSFTENLSFAYASAANSEQSSLDEATELSSLREKNLCLSKTIEQLKVTISALKEKIMRSATKERSQLEEIQNLILENKKLTATIEKLVSSIETQDRQATTAASNNTNHLRLFK